MCDMHVRLIELMLVLSCFAGICVSNPADDLTSQDQQIRAMQKKIKTVKVDAFDVRAAARQITDLCRKDGRDVVVLYEGLQQEYQCKPYRLTELGFKVKGLDNSVVVMTTKLDFQNKLAFTKSDFDSTIAAAGFADERSRRLIPA